MRKIIKSVTNVLDRISSKQRGERKRKQAAITKAPQNMIPDFFESVPMRLIDTVLQRIAISDDIHDDVSNPQFIEGERSTGRKTLSACESRNGYWTPGHVVEEAERRIDVTYSVTAAYFAGGSLCLDFRMAFNYAVSNVDFADVHVLCGTKKEATGVVILTMSHDGTVPHWFEQCIALASADLESDDRPACFLSDVSELALRVIYMKSKDRAGHANYLIQRTPADLLIRALAFMHDNDVECVTPLIGAHALNSESLASASVLLGQMSEKHTEQNPSNNTCNDDKVV